MSIVGWFLLNNDKETTKVGSPM